MPASLNDTLELTRTDGTILISDLGAPGGTRVNGQSVERAALQPGDHIGVGETEITLDMIEDGSR